MTDSFGRSAPPPCSSRKPNFFIVGAPKAGTTSLYHYLDQHPDIYMSPIKEPCYFSFEMRAENFEARRRAQGVEFERRAREYLHRSTNRNRDNAIFCEWPDYLRLFAGATTQCAVGEASVAYLWSKTAAEAIFSRIPDARIIMILRSPADRAFSHYLHRVSDGHIVTSFRDYVRACLRHSGEGLGVYEPFLELGFYAEQVQRYLNFFPREQIRIWLYEETKSHPQEFMHEVLEFLEVDPTFTPDISRRYNEPQIARLIRPKRVLQRIGIWHLLHRHTPAGVKSRVRQAVYRPAGSLTLEPQDRTLMLEFYRNDIHRLEEILDRDLSAWLA
jgi:Sulfotransferase family